MDPLTYDLVLAGLTVGSAAALTGIGLIVTYRATGVLNLAHGAIAMICAFLLRQLAVGWGWPLPLAACLTLLVAAPGLGLLMSFVGSDPARALAATIGVLVLLIGVAGLVWGPGARADAPAILPDTPWIQLAAVCVLAGAVAAVTRWTRFGKELRAVVDNRALAELGGIDAGRVAAAGWAFGAFTAGLTGVLLAPYVRLDPYGLPLLVMEVMAVAVAARMRSLPVAVGTALVLGVAQAQLTRFHPSGRLDPLLQALGSNLFVVALLIAALTMRGVGVPEPAAALRPTGPARGAVTGAARRAPDTGTALRALAATLRPGPVVRIRQLTWVPVAVLLVFPVVSTPHTAVAVPALAVVLLSLVIVTGRSGQLALGQAAYAGLGALFAARLSERLPELVALPVAVALVAPLGLLTGWPAIRRRGLALALTTFAVGTVVSRFVLTQPYATSGVTVSRPAGFGSDRAFYTLELALLGCSLLAVAALRRGRMGRALAAMRDHEQGAAAAGVPVPRLKLLAFVLGAALAALGGGLLSMGASAFDATAYDPVRGLLWFAALMILGADTLLAAPAAAVLLTVLDSGSHTGLAATAVGALALLLTRFRPAARPPRRLTRTPLGERARARLPRPPVALARSGTGTRAPRRPAPDWAEVSPPGPLTARGLRLSYGAFTVLDGVDLTVEPGRVTALVGPNGAGKSTLFHCLCGTLRPASGRVALAGTDITRRSAHARTRLGVARTFQQLAVFPSLTVAEQVRIGAEQGRVRDPGRTVESVLRLLDLDGASVRDRYTAGLPTGLLRRVELARA
ncbi:ABC transporter permease subunit, partial [Streptomyces beijiangensis]